MTQLSVRRVHGSYYFFEETEFSLELDTLEEMRHSLFKCLESLWTVKVCSTCIVPGSSTSTNQISRWH